MNDVTYLQSYVTLFGIVQLIIAIQLFVNYLNQKTMKNTTELKGNWNETKGKLKQKFAELTDNDVMLVEGKEDELLGRLQVKLGKTKEEMHKIIESL